MNITRTLITAMALAGLSAVAGAQSAYHATVIKPDHSGHCEANAVNESGVVVGHYYTNTGIHAFRWTPDTTNGKTGVFQDINPAGTNGSMALAINSSGEIVGYFWDNFNNLHAYRLAPGAAAVNPVADDIGSTAGVYAFASGINDAGQVVGAVMVADGSYYAYRTGAHQQINTTTDYISGTAYSSGNSINAFGATIGTSGNPSIQITIQYAAPGGGMLPVHTSTATLHGIGSDINYFGDYVGWYAPSNTRRAYVVSRGTDYAANFLDLGSLGGDESMALGINEIGTVVGLSNLSGTALPYHGFRYKPSIGYLEDLNYLVDDSIGAYTIDAGARVTAYGQIAGTAFDANGNTVGLLLTPELPFHVDAANPSPLMATGVDTTITVTGSGFIPTSTVVWGSAKLATTYVDDETLTAVMPASLLAYAKTANLYVSNPTGRATATIPLAVVSVMSSLTLSPNTAFGGTDVTGTLKLSAPVPAGQSLTITLVSDNAAATVGSPIVFTAGQSMTTFTIHTTAVAADVHAGITAKYNAASKKISLTVKAPTVSSVTATPTSYKGTDPAGSGMVTLNAKAAAGGMVVSLSSSSPAITVPPTVTVPAGAMTAKFSTHPHVVTAKTSVTVTAKTGAVGKAVKVVVVP